MHGFLYTRGIPRQVKERPGVRARLSSPLTPGLIGGGGGANYFADFLGIARTGLGRCDADEWFGIRVVFIFFGRIRYK